MKPRRSVLLIVVITITAIAISGLCLAVSWRRFEPAPARLRLLRETDHQRLLEACQELTTQLRNGDLASGKYRFIPWRSRTASRFPQAIQDLGPTCVIVWGDGCVTVEMLGGSRRFGVKAYPQEFKQVPADYEYGDRELIPNLWYYDGEYDRDPQYNTVIDKLLKKPSSE